MHDALLTSVEGSVWPINNSRGRMWNNNRIGDEQLRKLLLRKFLRKWKGRRGCFKLFARCQEVRLLNEEKYLFSEKTLIGGNGVFIASFRNSNEFFRFFFFYVITWKKSNIEY